MEGLTRGDVVWSGSPLPREGLVGWESDDVMAGENGSVRRPREKEINQKGVAGLLDLKSLTFLNFSNNNIIGKFPVAVHNLSKLEILDHSQNYIVGTIPDDIDCLARLSYLNLYANNFSGNIPAAIGLLPELRTLRLYDNQFNGTFPPEIGNLSKLEELSMAHNGFSPSRLHSSFTQLKKLKKLWISGENLIGEIPQMIAEMVALEHLDLSSNKLTGNILGSLFMLMNLRVLWLYKNKLSGEIPRVVEALNLTSVDLSQNNLTGTIRVDFGKLEKLSGLRLFFNQLSGEIPESIGRLPALKDFVLFSNNLSGSIPPDLGRYSALEYLCHGGSLRGVVAFDNKLALNLQLLMISDNLFTGELPNEVSTSLSRLEISNNKFSGSISIEGNSEESGRALPRNIISWKSLNILNLSQNQLSGQIPEKFGFLPDLVKLYLSDNQFSGKIQLDSLRLVFHNLSSNNLMGKIPTEYEDVAYATSFLNNPGLCTRRSSLYLNVCNSRPQKSSKTSTQFLALILRSGGSGKVYRVAANGFGDVAVKRISNNRNSDQKLEKEFLAEIEILGTIRHLNIVKLLCCISNDNSKLLVYEYMEKRSLDQWLHSERKAKGPSASMNHVALDWSKRLQIAVGAAQGLCYMHHDCSPPIVRRDVKSSNILLDSEFNTKIADFGLARMLVKQGELATVSAVAGSLGYIAPEYARTVRVNEKIDVYSFGVVLLELTTGKAANYGDEDTCLAEWAWRHMQEGKPIVDVLDEEIKEACYVDEMRDVFKLGVFCTSMLPSRRPNMKEVVQILLESGGGIRFFNCCGMAGPWKYAHEFFSISTLFKLLFHVQFVPVLREANVAADVRE
ncbi:hypothetical protein POTOM_057319 [Populus tomentosa]|uniref:Protein kinase domain-containing protein n=1 Tax=Populus tomentosa TaxID=118781 RepID=A0A8X7Y627_POPTO|nr:hypothetical protein POTOM_057319 [Populus tomentosa]